MMKDLIGLCCGCLMGVVVPLLFCRLAKHWNVLSDIAAGEIIAYTSEVIPFCFCRTRTTSPPRCALSCATSFAISSGTTLPISSC